MAWTYFTAYLDGSRPIYKTERDELYDQFEAKFLACSSSYAYDAAVMTTIKAHGAKTDVCKIVPSLSLGGSRIISIYDQMAFMSLVDSPAAFANFSAAQASALTDEGITNVQWAAIVNAQIESYHYWNVMKRMIDYLACIPTTSLTCRSKSATKTKCGYSEYGTPSSPPKIYLTRTLAGGFQYQQNLSAPCTGGCIQYDLEDYSGVCTYSSSTCSITTSTGSQRLRNYSDCGVTLVSDVSTSMCAIAPSGAGTDGGVVTSNTVLTWSGLGCLAFFGGSTTEAVTGNATETLSNEFTTADLATLVDTALAAASFGAYTTCVDAIYTRTSDELTIAKRAVDVKVTFSTALPAAMALRYDIYNRTGGVLVSNNCVNLSAGATNYVISLGAPPNVGDAYYVTNVTLTPGTC